MNKEAQMKRCLKCHRLQLTGNVANNQAIIMYCKEHLKTKICKCDSIHIYLKEVQ